MRVVLIAPDIPDYSIAFAEAISSRCDVLLVAPATFLNGRDNPAGARLACAFVNWPRHRSVRNLFFLPRLLWTIMRFHPDLIHISNEKNVWLNALLPFLRIPVVTTVHDVHYHPGDDGWGSVPRWCTHLFIRQSDAIVVHSLRFRDQAIESLPVKKGSLYVLPHISLTRYRDCALREELRPGIPGKLQVLFFGRLRRYKGLDLLIDAAKAVAREIPAVRFIIAGRSDRETARTLAAARPPLFDVRDRFISEEEAAQLFMDADLLVLPYIEASQSGVLAIACTFDLPVVASNAGDLGAIVADYETGIVVAPNDRAMLAKAIKRMLQDHQFRRTCAGNSRRMAEETGSANVSAKAISIYETIIERHHKARSKPETVFI